MADRRIFHLSIPVADLRAAARFYVDVLGARVGRQNEKWVDILLWGHQITLQDRPSEVLSPTAQGNRHFGAILSWPEWENLVRRLLEKRVTFLEPPSIAFVGTPQEQAKMYLADPSDNVIEIKAYRDTAAVLGYDEV